MKYRLNLVIEEKRTFKVDKSYITLHDGAIVDEKERIYELYKSWFEPIQDEEELPEISDVPEIEEEDIVLNNDEELLTEQPVQVAEMEEELPEISDVPEIEEVSTSKEDELNECKDRNDINAFVKKYDIKISLGNLKNIDKLKAKVLEVL
jgi:hypothetical protein